MGKQTRSRQEEARVKEHRLISSLAQHKKKARVPTAPRSFITHVAPYRAHAIRSPFEFSYSGKSSAAHRQLLALVRHTFARYPVPRFLERAWDPDKTRAQEGMPDFRAWYVALATGQSLYKTQARGVLSKKETHWFCVAPPDLSCAQALIWARARGANASSALAGRLARSRLADCHDEEFWREAVVFLSRPENQPASVEQINDLIDYLNAQREDDATYRILGRGATLATLLSRMEAWHRALARARVMGHETWSRLPGEDVTYPVWRNENGQRWCYHWSFEQITSARALAAEGSAQHHCVLGYKSRCLTGSCAIWSVRWVSPWDQSKRKLTLELDSAGNVVQARGFGNRKPRPDEWNIVHRWARDQGFRVLCS